jgi:hypothetical protein
VKRNTLTDPDGFNYVDYKGRIRWEESNGGVVWYGLQRLHEFAFNRGASLRLEFTGAKWLFSIWDSAGNLLVDESAADMSGIAEHKHLGPNKVEMSGALKVIVAAIHALERIDSAERKIGEAIPHRMTEEELEDEL